MNTIIKKIDFVFEYFWSIHRLSTYRHSRVYVFFLLILSLLFFFHFYCEVTVTLYCVQRLLYLISLLRMHFMLYSILYRYTHLYYVCVLMVVLYSVTAEHHVSVSFALTYICCAKNKTHYILHSNQKKYSNSLDLNRNGK